MSPPSTCSSTACTSVHYPRLQPGTQGMHCWGPDTYWVGCAALRNLLTSNPELAAVYVNRSYSREPAVASGFFKARFQGDLGPGKDGFWSVL